MVFRTAFEDNDDTEGIETLRNIDIAVKKGKLIGVCGSVGSGKTSLLSAVTGDVSAARLDAPCPCLPRPDRCAAVQMVCVRGDMAVNGSVAIVTQQAWIFNETLRENIIFGLPFDERRYRDTIEVCSLQRDLELLPKADMTEIGERGSNLRCVDCRELSGGRGAACGLAYSRQLALTKVPDPRSGGQKQRVNLARSVYANKDIYLLDDPLSAVDARVAKHIFTKCIQSKLSGKTVILVTHGIQVLQFGKACTYLSTKKLGGAAQYPINAPTQFN